MDNYVLIKQGGGRRVEEGINGIKKILIKLN